jgi:alpha-mannosidase
MALPVNRLALVAAAGLAVCAIANAQNRPAPDLTKQPTLYVVGYAHLDTEWRWEYPQVIDEYLKDTLLRNFSLFEKYPHYVFNFSGSNRYRFFKEYYPAEFEKLKKYVEAGRWFPAGSSVEEGDVNAPNAEGIIRQVLYGNNWFRKELGKASAEYMLPDCFGFPASLPSILAHAGVKGFSTQKLTWGSSVPAGGPESIEKTPEGIAFNLGVWVGPDGRSVVAALNPGDYTGNVTTDLSQPLPPPGRAAGLDEAEAKLPEGARQALDRWQRERNFSRDQGDWAARVERNGRASGVPADYHYYGTGDIGGAPKEESVRRLEAIVTRSGGMGEGPLRVVSAAADQLFLDLTPAEIAGLPRYTGEMELTNHSAGSLTSQAYLKRWLRRQETLADAAEKASIAAEWLGGLKYPLERLNNAWTLAMGTHFHDIAAGTATPRAYEFAWNDQVISLNQFASVFSSATETVAAALNTQTAGIPVVVFNPLNVGREDVVEAKVDLPAATKAVRVVGPDGEVPAQLSGGKVLFLATVPSVGYKVYEVAPAAAARNTGLRVSASSLENGHYRVSIDGNGDISSVFDKHLQRELLSAPARLAITYDNPAQYPAWNMDWDQARAEPRSYVGGPVKVRVVENGPVRVAVEVARETEGSRFVQTISLAAGDPGSRVEIANAIDWNTREANLKATFPLTASNQVATYNLDIGTIERPTNEPRKFEFPSHQWVDLTDVTGAFGATILTDCKNGSDKPRDNVLRLTLLRTPGTRGGYHDQATQDVGHHEFVYGIAGHEGDWRTRLSGWQGYRLNQPLVAFETARHPGALGKEFSLLRTGNPDIRVLAMKKAEQSDEVIVRLVEMLGHPVKDVRIAFAAQVIAAREVNGQEQPVGPANITAAGALAASFTAYQPRTFAVRLAAAPRALAMPVQSKPVPLAYDLAVATADGAKSSPGFDAQGRAIAASMLPGEIDSGGVVFKLGPSNAANAVVAKGQTIALPEGAFNRVYVLAASADGDRKATFRVGASAVELNVEDWGGFIGQWDDRVWKAAAKDPYAEMVKIVPGFIKRADVAWYCSHRHSASGANETYAYSYLFAYPIDLPAGTKTLTLPDDDKIRVMAVSVAREAPGVRAAQPLYDTIER